MEKNINWYEEFPYPITISDNKGTIIYMNKKSIEFFKEDGGEQLIGKNLYECHSAASNEKINQMIKNKSINIYTIEKKGKKKIIIQSPWYNENNFAGIVELSVELPDKMEHFVRE